MTSTSQGFPIFSPGGQDDTFGITAASPSVLGLSNYGYDEYTNDPRFLESQRELRDLLLTSAQSLAPTRAPTPDDAGAFITEVPALVSNASAIRSIVCTGERVVWLKNYLDEVAPWVSYEKSEAVFHETDCG